MLLVCLDVGDESPVGFVEDGPVVPFPGPHLVGDLAPGPLGLWLLFQRPKLHLLVDPDKVDVGVFIG